MLAFFYVMRLRHNRHFVALMWLINKVLRMVITGTAVGCWSANYEAVCAKQRIFKTHAYFSVKKIITIK